MGALTIPKKTKWSDLPEHLKERILEFLPVDCFFRFRAVCKEWNALFSSQHFNSIARNRQPFLILCPSNTQFPSLLYSFFTNTWRTISLSFIPHDCSINFRGSSSGLLLADITANFWFGYNSPTLCVCNPLTQVFSTLPEMSCVSRIMAKAILPAGDKMEEYRVVVVGMTSTGKVIVEAYNSTTKTWKVAGNIADVAIRNEDMFFFKGYLLGMTAASGGIMAYNIERGIARVVAMPTVPDTHNLWVRLVCCKSGVFAVGAIEENHILTGVVMWELILEKTMKEEYKWEEVGKIPNSLCEEFRKSSNSNWFECVGVGDVICFRAHESVEIVAYDVSVRNSWKWLPKFPAEMKYVSLRSFPLEITPSTWRLST